MGVRFRMSLLSDRRDFLRRLGVGAAWLTLPVFQACQSSLSRRSNMVIVMADDLGWGDLGSYGHRFAKTPNLDLLAGQGLRLTSYYAAGAICSPSRAGMLTGRHPYRIGVYDWIEKGVDVYLPREEITIARWLKQHGYVTCFAGKWHLSGRLQAKTQPNPGDHGFDHWLATRSAASPPIDPENLVRNGNRVPVMKGTAAHVLVRETVSWMEEHLRSDAGDRPFCLFVWFHEPHEPVVTQSHYRALYDGLATPEQANYYGGVSHMDEAFGGLLDALEKLGVADDTFVFFTSDNGPSAKIMSRGSSGTLRGKKARVYEGGIRVPGIVRWPGRIPSGSVSNEPVIGTDLFATLCEIAGIPLPDDRTLDGRSFVPVFSGGVVPREHPYYWHHPRSPFAMREGRWKLLTRWDNSRIELYDIESDVREKNNLAEREPERVESMMEKLRILRGEIEGEGRRWKGWPRRGPLRGT